MVSANDSYEKAIQAGNSTAEIYTSSAWTLSQLRDYDSAIKQANMAISINPKLARPHFVLSQINYNNNKFDVAKEYIVTALELEPNNRNYKVMLNNCKKKLKKRAK